jgi:hypothetical protein
MTLQIEGITYEVLKAQPYTHNGNARTEFTVKRPRGRRTYLVVKYENGQFSSVV